MIQLGLPSGKNILLYKAAMASLITPILDRDTTLSELASFCKKA